MSSENAMRRAQSDAQDDARVGGALEIKERDVIAGLEKGLAVIEAFSETRPRLSVTDAARITGLSRAAARRCLLTLVKSGYAAFDGKFFTLTPRILRLGHAYLSSVSLSARIQPFLERISEQTGESSSAGVLDDTDVVYIARSVTRRIMSIGLAIGSRLPAYCTSLGRALLAQMPEDELQAYLRRMRPVRFTPKTRLEEREIRAALDDVRRLGYALVDEELELGLRSIAVPVFNGRGEAVASINVSTQTGRTSVEQMLSNFLPVLRCAQEDLRRVI